MQIEWAHYPLDTRYMVSSAGEVYSLISDKLLSTFLVGKYLKTEIAGKPRFLHNLVLETFVSLRPAGLIGRHLDGVHVNNDVMNLIWGTHLENVQDSREHGTFRKLVGEQCAQSKLSNSLANEIRERYATGEVGQYNLGQEYGLSQARISDIVNFKSYKRSL